jgi:glycerol-3-phosphate dehydrogenase
LIKKMEEILKRIDQGLERMEKKYLQKINLDQINQTSPDLAKIISTNFSSRL